MIRSLLIAALLLHTATNGHAQSQSALPLALRGEAISRSLLARHEAVKDRVQVDACSIYEQLDRSPDYLRYLHVLVPPMLSSTSADPCADEVEPLPYRGWLSVERIAAEAPDRIVVEALFRIPRSYSREEFYEFRREGGELYPRGVRLMPGIYSDWQPLIPPTPAVAPDPTTGYLALAKLAARSYGLRAGDTLPELAPLQVPEEVRDAAGRIVSELAWGHSCTRYFSAGERYLILFQGTCPRTPIPGLIDERQRIGVLRPDGTPVSMELLWVGTGTVSVLCPAERDVHGRAANPNHTPDGCDRPGVLKSRKPNRQR
jgi:hypothetical protein